jgi:AsmA protein
MRKSGMGVAGNALSKDAQGWSLLPLKVKGSYSSPRFTLDSRGVKKQLKEGLAAEIDRQFKKKSGSGPEESKDKQLQDLLDDTLKKLLGN